VPATPNLRRALALAFAGGSLALGVPAALAVANSGDSAPASSSGASAPAFIQDAQGDGRRDRGDCPERGGSGQGEDNSSQGGSAGSSSATPTPDL
jgi:hypothetical protein